MAALDPELMLPAHGPAIGGRERVAMVLNDTATALEHLHDSTLAMMNAGARLDDIIHTVKLPDELAAKPYLRSTYDEPEFVVRNIWRLYGGWYDGNPANLKPARDVDLAREMAALAGGADVLARRGEAVAVDGDLMPLRFALSRETRLEVLREFAATGIDPEFPKKASPGDIIVGGRRFAQGNPHIQGFIGIRANALGLVAESTRPIVQEGVRARPRPHAWYRQGSRSAMNRPSSGGRDSRLRRRRVAQ